MFVNSRFVLGLSLCTSLVACQSAPLLNPNLQANSRVQANSASPASVNRVSVRTLATGPTVPGEIVIKYKAGLAAQSRQQVSAQFQLQTLSNIGHPEMGIELVKTQNESQTQQVLDQLNRNPNVLYAEPNYVIRLSPEQVGPQIAVPQARPKNPTSPNDPMFAEQYAHKVSNSLAGWKISQGSPKVTIAIVDTGVDLKHPDLAAKIIPGRDIVDNDDQAMDGHGHGTHCAGIAAAITNNQVGVAGFAPNVQIMPVRVLDDRGSGTSADVANGIIWAADHGAQVISMSLGGSGNPKVKSDAVQYALDHDSVLVAAMGNRGDGSQTFPAAQEGVISVGATDSADKRASFSQYGTWIDISAPGVDILSTFPGYSNNMNRKDYGSISGTSMATPAVAGVVALIRSVFPEMNREQVRAQLIQGTDDLGEPGYDIYYGYGRINVAKALTPVGRR